MNTQFTGSRILFQQPRIACFCVASLLVAVGCQRAQPPETTKMEPTESLVVTPVDEAAKQKAVAAKDALFTRLSGRLIEVIGSDGPAAAIEVCSREASAIAAEVSEQHGVRIGRTSFQLRNPKNAPPEWTKPFVQQRSGEPKFVALPNGTTGALLPIRLKKKCLTCHGPADRIAADVSAKLSEFYPDDQATGFSEHDLRGWFWIEVPAGATEADAAEVDGDHPVNQQHQTETTRS